MRAETRRLGITLMPEYLQNEGVEQVLQNVAGIAGASSVTVVPSVMTPMDGGVREPPDDGGAGDHRLLDRPLWGHRELLVRTAPSFVPEPSLYRESPYPPPKADDLTESAGGCVSELLRQCRARDVEFWLQLMAASPPGVRVQSTGPRPEDLAMRPSASGDVRRVDRNGSLASPGIRAFMAALIADVARAYPEATGFKFDWPEYPPYEFLSLFFDYNVFVTPIAERHGIDFDRLRHFMAGLLERFPKLAECGGTEGLGHALRDRGLVALLAEHPMLAQHFRLRALLVADYAAFLATCVRKTGKKIFLQGFPAPLNTLSGFDPAQLDGAVDAIGVKLYTMHWPMIARNYINRLAELGAGAPEELAPLVQMALSLAPGQPRKLADIAYPAPNEPHPASDADIAARLIVARDAVRHSEFWALAHGYGPHDDVARRLRAVLSVCGRVQMNRYGYLTDAKLATIGSIMRGG